MVFTQGARRNRIRNENALIFEKCRTPAMRGILDEERRPVIVNRERTFRTLHTEKGQLLPGGSLPMSSI